MFVEKFNFFLAHRSLSYFDKYDLSDLTIIIPTYERSLYLLRQIAYLSKWKTTVLIADGSKNPLHNDLISIIEKLPGIHYKHNPIHYPQRIFEASQKIKTPFAMCLAEDDFFMPSGLVAAIAKLEKDSNSIVCMGQALGFDKYRDSNYLFHYGTNLKNYSVVGNLPQDRIQIGLNNYRSATPYAVFRTNAFLKIWEQRENISSLEAVEYEHAIRTYLEGNLVTVPEIYWLRSFECPPVASSKDGTRNDSYNVWKNSARFKDEYMVFRKRITSLIKERAGISYLEAEKVFQCVDEAIVSGSHASLVDKTILSIISEMFSWLTKKNPFGLISGIKQNNVIQRIVLRKRYCSTKKFAVGKSTYKRGFLEDLDVTMEFLDLFSLSGYEAD